MNIKTLDGIVKELDYHSMWFEWMTRICPSAKELSEFNNMNKPDQLVYLEGVLK